MKAHTDLTFIVNEPGHTLKDRFEKLIKDCKFFDCLVAYFYISGFHAISKALEMIETTGRRGGGSSSVKLLKILKATQKNSKQLTEEQEEYLKKVITRLEEGSLPKQTVKRILSELNKLGTEIQNPLKVIGILQREISPAFLKSHYAETSAITEGKREVILSLYLAR